MPSSTTPQLIHNAHPLPRTTENSAPPVQQHNRPFARNVYTDQPHSSILSHPTNPTQPNPTQPPYVHNMHRQQQQQPFASIYLFTLNCKWGMVGGWLRCCCRCNAIQPNTPQLQSAFPIRTHSHTLLHPLLLLLLHEWCCEGVSGIKIRNGGSTQPVSLHPVPILSLSHSFLDGGAVHKK